MTRIKMNQGKALQGKVTHKQHHELKTGDQLKGALVHAYYHADCVNPVGLRVDELRATILGNGRISAVSYHHHTFNSLFAITGDIAKDDKILKLLPTPTIPLAPEEPIYSMDQLVGYNEGNKVLNVCYISVIFGSGVHLTKAYHTVKTGRKVTERNETWTLLIPIVSKTEDKSVAIFEAVVSQFVATALSEGPETVATCKAWMTKAGSHASFLSSSLLLTDQ